MSSLSVIHWFSILSAHWNHFYKDECLALTPRNSDLTCLGCCLSKEIFKNYQVVLMTVKVKSLCFHSFLSGSLLAPSYWNCCLCLKLGVGTDSPYVVSLLGLYHFSPLVFLSLLTTPSSFSSWFLNKTVAHFPDLSFLLSHAPISPLTAMLTLKSSSNRETHLSICQVGNASNPPRP